MAITIFKPEKSYWIFQFPYNYSFVFYGSDQEAKQLFEHKCKSEGTGTLRKADPDDKIDSEMVRAEIINVRLDREAGIPDLPFLPGKGWL